MEDTSRQPRRILFKVGTLSVDAVIRERDGRQVLFGQLVAGPEASPVEGVHVEVGNHSAVTDAAGAFALRVTDDVEAGQFKIRAPVLEFLCAAPARPSPR